MLGIIITTSYTANLISSIINEDLPIKSLKDFTEKPGWRLMASPGHSSFDDWKSSRDPYERELYRRAITGDDFVPVNVSSPDSVRDALQAQVMTFIGTYPLFYSLGDDACKLLSIPHGPMASKDVFMAISKRKKEFHTEMNKLLLKMKNRGVMNRLKARWIKSRNFICSDSNSYKPMTLDDLLAVMSILPLACCGSAIVFGLEWACLNMKRYHVFTR